MGDSARLRVICKEQVWSPMCRLHTRYNRACEMQLCSHNQPRLLCLGAHLTCTVIVLYILYIIIQSQIMYLHNAVTLCIPQSSCAHILFRPTTQTSTQQATLYDSLMPIQIACSTSAHNSCVSKGYNECGDEFTRGVQTLLCVCLNMWSMCRI